MSIIAEIIFSFFLSFLIVFTGRLVLTEFFPEVHQHFKTLVSSLPRRARRPAPDELINAITEEKLGILSYFLESLHVKQVDIKRFIDHYALLNDKCHTVLNTIPDILPALPHLPKEQLDGIRAHVVAVFEDEISEHEKELNAGHLGTALVYKNVLASYLPEDKVKDYEPEPEKKEVPYFITSTRDYITQYDYGFSDSHLSSSTQQTLRELSSRHDALVSERERLLQQNETLQANTPMFVVYNGTRVSVPANTPPARARDILGSIYPELQNAHFYIRDNEIHLTLSKPKFHISHH